MMVQSKNDLLKEIPSPSARLWAGLCIILSIFVIFAVFSVHQIQWLEGFQMNVVQKNRQASLQLLRLQNDGYLLAITLRDIALAQTERSLPEWRPGLTQLRQDMDDALTLEEKSAVDTTASRSKRNELRAALRDFWDAAGHVFGVAESGDEVTARRLLQDQLLRKCVVICEIADRLLVLNDQEQAAAAATINRVYGNVKRDILIIIGVLFLLALGTGFYTLQASRKTFERMHHLAETLQTQSEQLRRLSWKLIDLQEETLRHVARDLHDEFGQILTAVGTLLGRASQKAGENDPVLVKEVQSVKAIVEDTLRAIRDRSQMFRPAILDDFGLKQALEWLVTQFSRQTGIQVHFAGDLQESFFPPQEAIHLYRIVQEALNNVARHSRARQAAVILKEEDTELSLEIRDEGVGFDSGDESSRAPLGIGLMGMRERAEHLNGSWTLRSAPGKGTTIQVRVPLKKSALPRAAAS